MALHEWDGAVEAGEKATAFENTWSVNHSIESTIPFSQVGWLPNIGTGSSWSRSPGGCTHLFSEGGINIPFCFSRPILMSSELVGAPKP